MTDQFRLTHSRITYFAAIFLFALCLRAPAAAADQAPAADTAKVLAPFVDDRLSAVVRIDLGRIDLKAMQGWLLDQLRAGRPADNAGAQAEAIEELSKQLPKAFEAVEKSIASFQAAGGREIYLLLDLNDLASSIPPAAIIPIGPGGDADKLLKMIADPPGGEPPQPMAERVGNEAILFGSKVTRARLLAIHDDKSKRTANPDLLAAITSAGPDVAIHIAAAPSPDARKAFEQLAPNLPPQLGGGATADIARGLRWATLSIKFPPQPSIRVVVQSTDAKSAESLEKIVGTAAAFGAPALDILAQANKGEASIFHGFARLIESLTPKRDGDRVLLTVDERGLTNVGRVMISGLSNAREAAFRVQSQTNIRQQLIACLQWAATHQGNWPDDVASAMKALNFPPGTIAQLAANPREPKNPGYTYIKPPKDAKTASARIVIYETTPDGQGRGVGYMDGHAEWVDEARFQETLKAQK